MDFLTKDTNTLYMVYDNDNTNDNYYILTPDLSLANSTIKELEQIDKNRGTYKQGVYKIKVFIDIALTAK